MTDAVIAEKPTLESLAAAVRRRQDRLEDMVFSAVNGCEVGRGIFRLR